MHTTVVSNDENNANVVFEIIVTRNGKIVYKHGSNRPFYALMLRTKRY